MIALLTDHGVERNTSPVKRVHPNFKASIFAVFLQCAYVSNLGRRDFSHWS
jgi:hypothetical protein